MNNISIGIIGLGRFGSLIASILKNHAEIKVYSELEETLNEKAEKIGVRLFSLEEAAGCSIVILAVPISQTELMIKKISGLLKPGCLLVDTCSVKVYPCQWLRENIPENVQIMGTHPMFGPVPSKFDIDKQVWNINGLQIVLCPLRIKSEYLEIVKNFLTDLHLEVIVTSPEDHDEQNAVTLSLVHFLGRSLFEADIRKQRIFTPGFENLLKIYDHTTNDDWQLFFDMNNYNPFAEQARHQFLKACERVEDKIKENYEHTFKKNQ